MWSLLLTLLNVWSSVSAIKYRFRDSDLEWARTSEVYRSRLSAGYRILELWMEQRRISRDVDWAKDVDWTNQVLVDIVQDMYDGGPHKY